MEEVLRSLGGLMLRAIPTLLLVIFLHFYLKRMYFRPMEKVLKERFEATEGARKLAAESVALASEKAAEYEQALRTARAEIYREQEQFREQLREKHDQAVREARASAGDMVKQAQQEIAGEAAIARRSLEEQTGVLAERIADVVMRRRPV
jgi:F-type H+-transporting ATPase subunit b